MRPCSDAVADESPTKAAMENGDGCGEDGDEEEGRRLAASVTCVCVCAR